MISRIEIQDRLIFHEGLKLSPYKCPRGFWTIGVGRNLETNPLTAEEERVCGDWKHGISNNAAYFLLRNDINNCIKDLKREIPFYEKLSDERQYALLDMCFQMGIDTLLCFQKMLSYLGTGFYDKAGDEVLNSRYAKQTPKRAQRISNLIKTERFERYAPD